MSLRKLRWATFLAPNLEELYRRIAAVSGARLGITNEFSVGRSFRQFDRREIDVAFLCGLPYVELTRRDPGSIQPLAAPVLSEPRYGGRPIYFSDVVVHADSPFTSLLDLRGRSWAFNERRSHSGYNVTKYHLTQLGETRGFFGSAVEAGWHERALWMIRDRKIDGTAIDSHVLAVANRDDPTIASSVRVIETFGPSTIQPIVVGSHVDDVLREDLRSILVDLHEDTGSAEVFERFLVDRLVAIDDSDYEDIRAMLAAVEAAGTSLGPEVSEIPARVPPEVSLPSE